MAKLFHPPESIMPLPHGAPKRLPKIQTQGAFSEGSQDRTSEARKTAVKRAFIKSWKAYKKFAWAMDELMPISGQGKTTFSGWAAQLVDALDVLWMMDLKDDFYLAVREVAKINWSEYDGARINVFEVTIRYLGGLLAAYDLSQEKVLLDKAVELGDALYMAFDTPNHLPTHWLRYQAAEQGTVTGDTSISGAASGSLCLEFTRLSQLTGNSKYYDATERVKIFFFNHQNNTLVPGLWPWNMNFRDATIDSGYFTFGAGADSQYEYLPKMHALLGGLDPDYVQMTTLALDKGRDKLLFRPMTPGDENILLAGQFHADLTEPYLEPDMQHLTCFVGGMYGLAGRLLERDDYVDLASRLAAGCVWVYDSFPTNIMPEAAMLVSCASRDGPCLYNSTTFANTSTDVPDGFLTVRDRRYLLRPEAIESVFYMWRITGDQVWRDAAWRMWEGIVEQAETELAFAVVDDVTTMSKGNTDSMEVSVLLQNMEAFS